jgi:adenine-specific DNA-methyltransferase
VLTVMLDQIFGEDNFINEIIWQRTSAHNDPGRYGRIHDTLFYYAGRDESARTWTQQYDPNR